MVTEVVEICIKEGKWLVRNIRLRVMVLRERIRHRVL